MPATPDRKVIGSAGEHFVCSVLAQRGWAAALTREGVADADILAVAGEQHGDAAAKRPMVEIQVKAIRHSHSPNPSWPMGGRWTVPAASDREWFVFVLLGESELVRPRCFVVPRDHVSAGCWIAHMSWLTDPDAAPGKRNTPVTNMRMGLNVVKRYEERWELLEKSTDAADVLLPPDYPALARERRIDFPTWHPWHKTFPECVQA